MAAVAGGRPERVPSLRRRLLTRLLVPLGALAVGLGVGGSALIHGFVQSTHDRLLAGSTLAIAERLAVDDDNGEVTVDLPAVAFGMLESQARDSIYYNVAHEGGVITGYLDLPLPDISKMPTNVTVFRDATYRGHAVRVAAQIRRLYGVPQPVLVQVAETTAGRRAVEVDLLLWLTLLEVALVGGSGLLVWGAVGRGLAPLGRLRRVIDSRSARGITGGGMALVPLPLAVVPVEVLPLVIAINGLLARLDQSIGTMRRFTADASHQLRTPLAVLRTHLALLRRFGTDSAEGRAALDDVEGAVKRLERLLVQLLALARADEDAPAVPAAPEVTDLRQVAMEVAAEQVPAALAQDIEVRFEGPEDGDADLRAVGNPVLVGELLGNLLDNAIRYNRPGGTVTVRVGAGPVLEVEDDGPGIPGAERERVFERFYRLDRPGEPPRTGSGLGLAIVRALADRLGAAVRLDGGADGRGLKVTVVLRPAESDAASKRSMADDRGA
ncbi:sensor histidine kinase [Azospirillum sp. TSO5]|uniref:sensor histidine kinase n=1 Tax=Azospirillum sp. TSO5 TaxID=716760 RepID=UPI000D6155E5|nr:sensor histidine kinase [Azospirillum sp. TSO5]PWC92080.1 histidine kinase [Azospirillum sp. TSO5]